MLTRRDTEVTENRPTCTRMQPASQQQCEGPDTRFNITHSLRTIPDLIEKNMHQQCNIQGSWVHTR